MSCEEFYQAALETRARLPHFQEPARPLLMVCDGPVCAFEHSCFDPHGMSFEVLANAVASINPNADFLGDLRDCAECELFGPPEPDEVGQLQSLKQHAVDYLNMEPSERAFRDACATERGL